MKIMKDVGGTGMPGEFNPSNMPEGFDTSNMPENPIESSDEPVIEEID